MISLFLFSLFCWSLDVLNNLTSVSVFSEENNLFSFWNKLLKGFKVLFSLAVLFGKNKFCLSLLILSFISGFLFILLLNKVFSLFIFSFIFLSILLLLSFSSCSPSLFSFISLFISVFVLFSNNGFAPNFNPSFPKRSDLPNKFVSFFTFKKGLFLSISVKNGF